MRPRVQGIIDAIYRRASVTEDSSVTGLEQKESRERVEDHARSRLSFCVKSVDNYDILHTKK